VPLVPRFARHVQQLEPATALAGHAAGTDGLRVVRAALLTCEDVITRALENGVGPEVGLRGGTFTVAERGSDWRITLQDVRWTEDLQVSGRLDLPAGGGGQADLEVRSPQGRGRLELTGLEGMTGAPVNARGTLGGKLIAAEVPP
jgi:hypothetical protein